MAEVLIALFQDSGSFEEAKARIRYLEGLRVWEPSYSTRIESALESNSQISGSFGVPERVNRLINKRKGEGAGVSHRWPPPRMPKQKAQDVQL